MQLLILFAFLACVLPAEAYYYGRCGAFGCTARVVRPARHSRYYGGGRYYGRRLLEESEDSEMGTIHEVLKADPETQKMAAAVERLPEDFKKDLMGKTFTVFAPTDSAIDELYALDPSAMEMLKNETVVLALLSYTVLEGEFYAKDLSDGQDLTTLTLLDSDNFPLMVAMEGDGVIIKGVGSEAKVTEADIKASNGVIHKIDTVLLPADLDGKYDEEGQLKPKVENMDVGPIGPIGIDGEAGEEVKEGLETIEESDEAGDEDDEVDDEDDDAVDDEDDAVDDEDDAVDDEDEDAMDDADADDAEKKPPARRLLDEEEDYEAEEGETEGDDEGDDEETDDDGEDEMDEEQDEEMEDEEDEELDEEKETEDDDEEPTDLTASTTGGSRRLLRRL